VAHLYAGKYGPQGWRTRSRDPLRAPVTVYLPGTSNKAPLYTDYDRQISLDNPVAPDPEGNVEFWAAPGEYELKILSKRYTVTIDVDPREPVSVADDVLVTTANADAAITVAAGTVRDHTASVDVTVTLGNAVAGVTNSSTLILRRTSNTNLTFGHPIVWIGTSGVQPTLPGTAATSVFTFMSVDGGANWFGFYAGSST
jgi:hypothetical protein